MQEVWKDIKGYENKYQISNLGRVKSLKDSRKNKREKILSLLENKKYIQVMLCKEGKGKRFLVHRLVAEAFIPNPNNYPCINHKDENPSNNNSDNLEWCTFKYNNNYGNHSKKISESHKGEKNPMYGKVGEKHPMYGKRGKENPNSRKVICVTTGEMFNSVKEAENKTNNSHISECCRGKRNYAGKHPITKEKLVWRYYNGKTMEERR